MFRTPQGIRRPSHLTSTQLPEYPIPSELETVLDVNDKSTLSRKAQMYSKVLESLSTVKYVDLSEGHYIQLLKFALYLEEYQSNEEMKKRKMYKQTIKKLSSTDPTEILFSVHVKELDEERAWIKENDFVDVIDTNTYKTYTLRVCKVEQCDIVASDDSAKLTKDFRPTNLYNINFRFSNYPLRCAHYALWVVHKENVTTYLFPHKSKSFIKTETEICGELTMFNPNIESNPEQKQAVLNILNKSSFPAPYILYGPPGTGKTATLIEAICQIRNGCSSNRILVCTPSNTAADEVAKRLLKFLDACEIYRIYSQSKERSTVEKELRNCCYCGDGSKRPLRREDITDKAVLISTLCTATRFVRMQLNSDYFSHIIIDEAGQGTEPDMLIPIAIASKDGKLHTQVVLAGDPQQLGPTVISKLADVILGRSILERIMSYGTYRKDDYNNYNPRYMTKLLHNYRSHPSIIHISNKLFYDNELVAKVSNTDQKVKFPVIFHGVEGVEEKYSYSPSTFNYEEIRLVLKYVYDLIDNKTEFGEVSAKDIGIVTPFKLQSKRIRTILQKKDAEEKRKHKKESLANFVVLKKGEKRNLKSNVVKGIRTSDEKNKSSSSGSNNGKNVLESEEDADYLALDTKNDEDKLQNKKEKGVKIEPDDEDDEDDQTNRKRFKDINVGTVELFQGQERKIMIMTAVRSKTFFNDGKEHIGFLSNPKRFNVAMTRAQSALIVIGNPGILQKDGMWQYLLKYCIENQSYRGLEFQLRPSCIEKSIVLGLQNMASSRSLFKGKPFKLFPLDVLDSTLEISKTVDLFVDPENVDEELVELGNTDEEFGEFENDDVALQNLREEIFRKMFGGLDLDT